MLTPNDYRNALLSQSACNASGLVHSLAAVLSRLCEAGMPTDERNQHPIVVLYVTQLHYLAGLDGRASYSRAYAECAEKAKEAI